MYNNRFRYGHEDTPGVYDAGGIGEHTYFYQVSSETFEGSYSSYYKIRANSPEEALELLDKYIDKGDQVTRRTDWE